MRSGPASDSAWWPPDSLLGVLSPKIREALLSLGQEQRYDGGYSLIQEGARSRYVMLLVNASVKVTSTTADGQVTLLAVRRSGDIVGELAGLDGQPRIATATTVGMALVRLIPHTEFLQFLHEHPAAAVALSQRIAEKLRATTRRRVDFGGTPVVVRLCRLLDELTTELGERPPRVHLTQYELATLVGAAEISVSRALRMLTQDGIVRTGYGWIEVRDQSGLRRAVDRVTRSVKHRDPVF